MTVLSKRAAQLKPSATLSISAKASALKKQGKNVIDFGAGQPDVEPSAYVKEAVKKAVEKKGIGKYTAVEGTKELREAICAYIQKEQGVQYAPENIIVTVGGKQAIFNAFQALLNRGDEVVIPSPYWASFPEMARYALGAPVFVDTDEKFQLSAKDVLKEFNIKTKMMVINSPCNPTGAVFDPDELRIIAEAAAEKGILILADDTYDNIIYERKHFCIPAISEKVKKQTVYVNTLSKTFAIPGFRIGYAAAEKEIVSAMAAIQSQSTSNADSLMQEAAIAALSAPKTDTEAMVAEFQKRRDYIVAGLNRIPGISCPMPEGAFYVFPKIPFNDSVKWATELLEKKLVAVVPGAPFGREGHVRISYACPMKDIEEGLNRIREFVGG